MMFHCNSKITDRLSLYIPLISFIVMFTPVFSNAELYTHTMTIDTFRDDSMPSRIETIYEEPSPYEDNAYSSPTKQEEPVVKQEIIMYDLPFYRPYAYPYYNQSRFYRKTNPPYTSVFNAYGYNHARPGFYYISNRNKQIAVKIIPASKKPSIQQEANNVPTYQPDSSHQQNSSYQPNFYRRLPPSRQPQSSYQQNQLRYPQPYQARIYNNDKKSPVD